MRERLSIGSRWWLISPRHVLVWLWSLVSMVGQAKPPAFSPNDLMHSPSKIIRPCCTFGADLSVARIPFLRRSDIIAPDQLGDHRYLGGNSERNGIIYTRKGGFVDIAHLRDVADWTGYLFHLVEASEGSESPVSWMLGLEGGEKKLFLKVPAGLGIAQKAALAGRIAYELSVWHEIATWYNGSILPFIPERYSSFSPEDLYSNMLGAHLGIRAIESELEFDEAMTLAIRSELADLDALLTAEATYEAMSEVEGIWWTNDKPLPDGSVLLARYVESGDTLHPWRLSADKDLVPDRPLIRPGKSSLSFYELRFDLYRLFRLSASPCLGGADQVYNRDFPKIMECISEQASWSGNSPPSRSGVGK